MAGWLVDISPALLSFVCACAWMRACMHACVCVCVCVCACVCVCVCVCVCEAFILVGWGSHYLGPVLGWNKSFCKKRMFDYSGRKRVKQWDSSKENKYSCDWMGVPCGIRSGINRHNDNIVWDQSFGEIRTPLFWDFDRERMLDDSWRKSV